MAPRSCAAQHPSSRSPTLSPDDVLKLPALCCGGISARFAYFIQNQAPAGRRHPSTKFGRSSHCCSTARITCYTKRNRRLREQESSRVLLQLAGRRMVKMACQKTRLLSFSVRPSIVFGTHAYGTLWRATFQLVIGPSEKVPQHQGAIQKSVGNPVHENR